MASSLPIHRVDLHAGAPISVTYATPTVSPSSINNNASNSTNSTNSANSANANANAASMYTLIPPASPTVASQTFWIPPPSPHQQPSFHPRLSPQANAQTQPGAVIAAAIAAATAANTASSAAPVAAATAARAAPAAAPQTASPGSALGGHYYYQPPSPTASQQEHARSMRMVSVGDQYQVSTPGAQRVVPLSQKAALAEAKKASTTGFTQPTPIVPMLELSKARGAFRPEDTTSTWDPADTSSPPGLQSTSDSGSSSSNCWKTPCGTAVSSAFPSTQMGGATGLIGPASPRREPAPEASPSSEQSNKVIRCTPRGHAAAVSGHGTTTNGAPIVSPGRHEAATRTVLSARTLAAGRAGSKSSTADEQAKSSKTSSNSSSNNRNHAMRQTSHATLSHRPPRWAPPAAEPAETCLDQDTDVPGKVFRPPPRTDCLPALLSHPKVVVDGQDVPESPNRDPKQQPEKSVGGAEMSVAAKIMVAPRSTKPTTPSTALTKGDAPKKSPRGPLTSARDRGLPGGPSTREVRRHSSPQPHQARTLKPPTPRLGYGLGHGLGPPTSCPSSLRAPAAAPSDGSLSSPRPASGTARAMSPSLRRAPAERPAGLINAKDALHDSRKLRQLAQDWFKRIDADRNGSLSFEELVRGIKLLNRSLGIGEFRERDVARVMRRFDTNCDGILSATEFYQVYRYLLLAKVHEEEMTPFCRNMFLGRRLGEPSDHYEISDVIGQGSFGIVKKIVCKDTRALRVLKSIDKESASKSGLSPKAVIQEIDKLKALDHPAVLRLFEYFADNHYLHLVTDHLPGGELNTIIEQSHVTGTRPAEDWLQQVFRQVCCGVAYCHGKGVMHRDLKLENIMLGGMSPPEAIIIDMGLAELFPPKQGDSHRCKAPTGSIPTMAPEVFRHSSTYKCDVWSLGCCLYAMFCEKPTWFKSRSGRTDFYGYPFMPPKDHSKPQLEEYLRRQRAGPKFENLWSQSPSKVIFAMLTFDEEVRPNIPQLLGMDWLKAASASDGPDDDGSARTRLEQEELDCLMSFHRCSALDEVMLLSLASQLPFAELAAFRDLFLRLDCDGDGRLDVRELSQAMHDAGVGTECSTEAARKLTKSGPLEFSRFVAALVPSRPELLTVYLKDAFNRLDTDGDGVVTASELRSILEQKQLPGAYGAGVATTHVLESFDDTTSKSRRNSVSFECLSQHASALCA